MLTKPRLANTPVKKDILADICGKGLDAALDLYFRDGRLDGADCNFITIKPKIKDIKLNNIETEIQAYLAMLCEHALSSKTIIQLRITRQKPC